MAAMKKIREENQKRAQRIKGRKERQLKIVKEKIEKRGGYREGCRPSRRFRNTKNKQIY